MIICVQCRTSNRDGTRFCRRCGAFLSVETPHDTPGAASEHEQGAAAVVERHDASPVVEPDDAPPVVERQDAPPVVERHETVPPVEPHDNGAPLVEHHDDALTVERHEAEPPPELWKTRPEESSWHIADEPVLHVIPERKEGATSVPPIVPVQPPPPPRTNWRMTAAIALGAAAVSGWAGYQMAGSRVGRQLSDATAQIRELSIALNVRQKHLEQQAAVVAGLQDELEKARKAAVATDMATDTAPRADQQRLAQENQILRGQIRQSDTAIARLQERLRRFEAGGGRQPSANARTQWGDLTWTGDPGAAGVMVTVNGSKAKPGSLHGRLPGLDCTVEPEDPKQVTVLIPPSAPQWNQMAFRVGSGGKKTVVHLRLSCLANQ